MVCDACRSSESIGIQILCDSNESCLQHAVSWIALEACRHVCVLARMYSILEFHDAHADMFVSVRVL